MKLLWSIVKTTLVGVVTIAVARLRALRETTVFPCDKLMAAGFLHPRTTRDGLAEMIAWAKAQRA